VIRALGFGQKTGIELPAESPGLYRPLPTGTWSALTPAGLALGQEISVTAIQLARAYAALANGGLLVQPTLIAEVRDREGNQVAVNGKNTFKRALPQEVAKAVATLLQGVVEEGTGKAAAVAGYPVAGKTGTAQKAVGGSYRAGQHAAWFAGFLPMPNPRLVLVVCVDEPRQTFWASEVAAPAFGRMARRLVHVLQVPPSWGGQA
jgi:cell division protein FtsI/penicillin-binding protein 2